MSIKISGLVQRRLGPIMRKRLSEVPVTVIAGPRAIGKSTLLQNLATEVGTEVIDLDDLDTREAATRDPALFASGPAPVLIDEFQHVPQLLDAIKAELNRLTTAGRYVLTGSTRYETLPRTAQSLTGRASILRIWPLSQGEIDDRPEAFLSCLLDRPENLVGNTMGLTSRQEYIERVAAGGYPLALMLEGNARQRWFADYVTLVCERDVLDLTHIRQREQLPRLLTHLAARTGQLLNVADVARPLSIESSTAENYTRLLEAVFMVYRIPAWGVTAGSRISASPKLHVVDSGLAAHLLRLTPDKLARRTPQALTEFGHLLETFVTGELLKQMSWLEGVVTVGHWRTRDGMEVDLLFEQSDGAVVGVEIKSGSRVDYNDARGLMKLADQLNGSWLGGIVLYLGTHSYTLDQDRNIHVLPLDALWLI